MCTRDGHLMVLARIQCAHLGARGRGGPAREPHPHHPAPTRPRHRADPGRSGDLSGEKGSLNNPLDDTYVLTHALAVSAISAAAARAHLHRIIDQVNDESEPLTITGRRGNAVLVGEDDWRAIQETLRLASIPGLTRSIREARADGLDGAREELDW